ncbi:MAG: GNAT family N-acetyltransferase [Oscillospiraceae bacterium]|nr:GNAT family N-acetyltransferase [Oscillospiraceae bacterium]
MNIKYKNLTVRQANENDAVYIHKYRSESGENISLDKVKSQLGPNTSQYMIELDGQIIGDIHYGDVENKGAEIGVYIRDENEKDKGYGTLAITMFSDYLLNRLGYDKIVFNTAFNNGSMRHIAESKFSLKPNVYDAYQEISGTDETCVEYELKKENWKNEINYEVL